MSGPLRSALRAPEGRWAVSGERPPKINFSPDAPVALSWATLGPDPSDDGSAASLAGDYLILNTQHCLLICRADALDRVRCRRCC